MRPAERLRFLWLRWSRLGVVGLLVLPLGISSVLGFFWLAERGWLLWFVAGSVAVFLVYRLVRLALGLRRRKPGQPAPRQVEAPPIDPEWTAGEREAYAHAQALIAERLTAPIAWEDLPAEALVVVETVAAQMSRGKRSALDFTLPEALLLIDRVALRYREFLRRHVPFSDQLSVRALYWLWQRQDKALVAWETGFLAYRGVRLVLNPAVGMLREVERAITAGLQDRLTDQFLRDAQAILLEEAAQAAVDLYSGRLRFSDAELMQLQLGSELRDRSVLAQPDDPVRILIVGQVSAGKSSLVNALLGRAAAETDMAPTTAGPTAHELSIDDIPCRLIDTGGLDGTEAMLTRTLAEMVEADLVLWVLRVTRPGRAADVALMRRFEGWFRDRPERRQPPVLIVATAADTLMPGWPYPEDRLPGPVQQQLGAAMAAIAAELGRGPVIPLRAEPPAWNLDTLIEALSGALVEALMTQRNRRRTEGAKDGLRLRENLLRAGRGLGKGARVIGTRLLRRER